ncbi:hypothetical protein W02_04030 [Nitrospira sp. KM1]|nr:hypothetical protein W02_04030 [Nitrospira sp. KM1]
MFELYLVGSLIKLNPPLPTGQSVVDFAITPDRSAVVYRANQDTADAIELYRVEFAQPGVSKKLNPMLPLGGDVNAFQIAADSSSVIYVADQAADEVHELYRVSFAAPGISTKLNGPLAPGGNVFFGFSITPDNASVVYSAAQDTANTVELYRVFLATPELSTKLNGLLPTDADVSSLSILPNNSGVVYTVSRFLPTSPGSQFSFLTSELYFVSFSTPGGAFKLNAPLAPFAISYILSFRVTPDSSSVVYLTANSSGDQRQLFRVRFASPGTVDKLHGSDVYALHYRVTPDSTAAVFAGNGIGVSVSSPSFPTELYLAPFSTPGTNTKLNGPLAGNLGLLPFNGAFEITRNGLAAVYVAREKVSTSELYMVPFSTPGLSTTLNGSTVAGGGVYPFGSLELTPDSTGVLYQANQTTPGTTELYRVEFANPGVSTKLNGSLVSGGNVEGGLVR